MLSALILVAATAAADLESVAYENGTVGIRINLPLMATVNARSTEPPSVYVGGGNPLSNWHLRFDRVANTAQDTPRDLVMAARGLREDPEGTAIIADESMDVGELQGWWLLLSQPAGDLERSVHGWLALPAPGNQTILIALLTNDGGWRIGSEAIMASLGTLEVLNPVDLIACRLAGLQAAEQRLAALSREALSPLIGHDEWRRIRSRDGTDLGYGRVQVEEAPRGILNGAPPESGYSNALAEQGLLVRLQSRIVADAESGIVFDTFGLYWMSWDGQEEAWRARTLQWKDQVSSGTQETGIRTRPTLGNPRSRLIVLRQEETSNMEAPFEAALEQPFIPKTLSWIIGTWLGHDAADGTFAWHAFDDSAAEPRIAMRTDLLEPTGDGAWRLTTSIGEHGTTLETIVDARGRLLHQNQPGGVEVTVSSEQTLQSIWAPRNLW